jgi:L-Ala-D/L-Glu epimerase
MLIPLHAELLHIAIPFRFSFRHALAARAVGEGVLLVLRDAAGRAGHGECTPRGYVSGESAESVMSALSARLPGLLGRRWDSFEALVADLQAQVPWLSRDAHAAHCALELALLDLGGRAFGRPAAEPVGPLVASRVAYSGVVSAGSADAAVTACAQAKAMGVSRLKVKVGGTLEEDLAVLAAVRETAGPDAQLRVDANGAWDARTALDRLEAFARFRLEGLEQPCAADDLQGLAWLAGRSQVPIIADESLVSLDDARRLAAARACHVFNVRISKCGGLLSAARIRDLGRGAGIATMLGAHVGETAILAAAGRHVAARTPELRVAEGSYGSLLLEADVSRALDLQQGGLGDVPAGDGLGLDPDLARIEPWVVERREFTAAD